MACASAKLVRNAFHIASTCKGDFLPLSQVHVLVLIQTCLGKLFLTASTWQERSRKRAGCRLRAWCSPLPKQRMRRSPSHPLCAPRRSGAAATALRARPTSPVSCVSSKV